MPQVVNIEGVGRVNFPDEMDVDQITLAIENDILPQFKPSAPPEPEATSENLGGRFAASVSENALLAAQGLEKIDRFIPLNPLSGIIRAVAPEAVQDATGLARSAQELSRESYGVTTPADTLLEKVVEGAGSLPPVLASGPLAPVVNAGLVGESQLQDAQRFDASPSTQAKAFIGGAAVGAASEYLLGVPAMLRGGGGRRILDTVGLGFAREGTQEAVQEGAGNVVAQQLYDADRDLTEGVKEAGLIGGLIGAPLGPLAQGAREGAPDTTRQKEILSQIEDTDEPDLTGFGSANPAAQAPAPPVVTPEQQASATILNQDPVELRQQEAIVTGNPVEVVEEEVVETPVEEVVTEQPIPATPETVGATLAAEEGQDTTQPIEEAVAAPEGLVVLEPDSYERLADEPIREGWVGYQDPETLQAFQVPEGSTPEVIQQRLQEVRAEESDAFRAEREATLERELTQKRFDENVQRLLDEQNSREPVMRKDLLSGAKAQEVWSQADKLTFTLDREKMRLAEAKKNLARLQSSANQRAKLEAQEEVQVRTRGVEILIARMDELQPKVEAAQKAVKGMKKGQKPEGGAVGSAGGSSVTRNSGPDLSALKGIPQEVIELGKALYRKDISFADWSKAMVKALGNSIKESLKVIYDAVGYAMDAPIRQRARQQSGMKRRTSARAGAINPTVDPELYDTVAQQMDQSTTDTRPNQDFTEADKQAIRDAYAELQQKSGFGAVPIADVMEAAEMPLSNQSKGLLMQMYQNGEITSLNIGDWSLANNRKRAWAVRNQGDLMLSITMPKGMVRAAPAPEGGSVGSQGGRRGTPPPQTPPAATPEPEQAAPVGVMNASVDAARVKMGLPPAMAPARITLGGLWEEAMAIISNDPNIGTDLVTQLTVAPREITPVETAILVHERVKRETEYMRAINLLNNSATEGEKRGNQEVFKRASDANQALFDVTKKVGTLAGQALAARKLLVNEDLSLAKMLAENRAAQGGKELTPEQVKDISDTQKELQRLRDELAKRDEQASKESAMEVFKSLMKDMNAERKEAVKTGKSVTEFLKEQADLASARMQKRRQERGQYMNIATNPASVALDLVDAVVIGAYHISNGITSLANFTAKILEEFGPEFEQYVPQVFEEAQKKYTSDSKAFGVAPASSSEPAAPATPETPADILKDVTTLDPRAVFELARYYVRQGVTGMENVMNAVHADMLQKIPGLDIRDVRDAFSGYGKTTYPSKQDDLVKLREYKVLARLTSQLEDVERRKAPLRTGPQRDKLSAESRILQKQISDLMKKYDIRTTSPEQQLKTSADAVKTRLRNQIEELEKSIADNQALPTNRRTLQYDEEAKALAARRDQLKARYNELFKPPGKTPDEKIAAILKNLDKSIAEEDQLLRSGIYKRPSDGPRPTNDQIEDKRRELEAMRKLRRELYAETQPRKSPEDVALEQAIKSAKKSIERMDQMIKTGNIAPTAKAPRFTPTAELEALWAERDDLNDALAELRKAAKPRTDPEETRRKQAVKALEKSIKMLDERMLRGDFGATPRKATRPEVKEVSELRDLRDSMRQAFNDLKKAQTPPKDPIQVRLARDKKVIQGRMKKLQEKINSGDYSTAVKKDPPTDAQKRQLQYDYQKLRETYLKGVFELKLKNRNLPQKFFGSIAETWNTSRSIITSIDVSAVLRQGGFIAFARPVRAARNLPAMFKAFASEKTANDVMESIKERPNYKSGLYDAAGLYLADDAPASLNKMEEVYMSRWAQRITGKVGAVVGGAIGAAGGFTFGGGVGALPGAALGATLGAAGAIQGSQRAYTTFLNLLRADSFDAMVEGLSKTGTPTTVEAEAVANFVNAATGRASLGKYENAGQALNTVFFAPRYVISRFQLLTGQPFYGGNARTRKAIAWEYGRYLAGISVVMALAAAAGDDEERGGIFGFKVPFETDWRSSDFMKVRFGNTRLDLFSGLIQATVVIGRLGTNKFKRNGELINLSGKDRKITDPTWFGVGMTFLRTKLSPMVGNFIDVKSESNVVGETVTPASAALRMMVPISTGEIVETMTEHGIAKGAALSLVSLFGAGLQTYPEREKKASKSKDPYRSEKLF